MHKIKIISIAITVLLIVVFSVYLFQPKTSEIQEIPQSISAKKPIPNFAQIKQTEEKKKAFFSYLRPEVETQNAHILLQREFVHGLRAKHIAEEQISENQMEELRSSCCWIPNHSNFHQSNGLTTWELQGHLACWPHPMESDIGPKAMAC